MQRKMDDAKRRIMQKELVPIVAQGRQGLTLAIKIECSRHKKDGGSYRANREKASQRKANSLGTQGA